MARASTSVRRGPRDVVSAGVVVFGPGRTVLLVHRPKYDDWSFPKGKLDRGERAAAAAVREVEEETGLRVRLGPPLGSQRYPVRGGMKTVVYWTGRPVDATDVSTYEPNAEIDDVAVGAGRRGAHGAHLPARRRHARRGASPCGSGPGPSSCSGTPWPGPGATGRRTTSCARSW